MRNPTPGAENAPHHGGHGGGPSADLLSQMTYETRDVSLIALSRWLGVFVIFIVGSLIVAGLVFKLTVLDPLANQKRGLIAHVQTVPPFPQVQPDPKTDMMDYRNAEDQVLSGAGSGSTKPGVSIDDAIEAEATQHGISGIKGDATPWNYSTSTPTDDQSDKSYPGGGDYGTSVAPHSPPTNVDPGADVTDGAKPDVLASPAPTDTTPEAAPTASPSPKSSAIPAVAAPAPNGNGTTP